MGEFDRLRYRVEELELAVEALIRHLGLERKIPVPLDYGKNRQRADPSLDEALNSGDGSYKP